MQGEVYWSSAVRYVVTQLRASGGLLIGGHVICAEVLASLSPYLIYRVRRTCTTDMD